MIPVTRRWMAGIYLQPEHSDGVLVIPSRHHASHHKRGWPGNRQTFKNTTTAMFATRLNTAITVGITHKPQDRPAARSRTLGGCSRAWSRRAVLTGRSTDPLPLLGIDLRPGQVAAAHDQRPTHVWDGLVVFVAGVRVLWYRRAVLAARRRDRPNRSAMARWLSGAPAATDAA